MSSRYALLVVFLVALGLFAATVQTTAFSDAVYLSAKVESGPKPYYNALYLPLGWAFHRLVSLVLDWDAFEALGLFSALCGAGAAAFLAVCLRRIGCSPGWRIAWGLFFVVTPGVWFFSTTVEVHSIQLLGTSAATAMCLLARRESPGRALALVYAACALALLSHLTTVLILPGFVVLARGDGPGVGLGLKGLPWKATLLVHVGLLVVVVGVFWAYSANPTGLSRSNPLEALEVFFRKYVTKLKNGRFYGPSEIADFLGGEFLRPAGLLAVLPLVRVFAPRRNRLFLPAFVAALPYLVLLPQGGIREQGGYFVSFFPLFVLATADSVAAIGERAPARARWIEGGLVVLLVVQAWLGWSRVAEAESGVDARDWTAEVEEEVPRTSVVFTTSLARMHALKYGELRILAPVDLNREFEMTPVAGFDREANHWLGVAAKNIGQGLRVFFDADFFDARERPESHRRLEELLATKPVRLEPLPSPPEPALLYELFLEQ